MVMQAVSAKEIKTFVAEQGADLAGIATVDCLEKNSRRGPTFIIPEAQSIIFFARRMLRGFLEGPSDMVVTVHGSAVSSACGHCPALRSRNNESGGKGRQSKSRIKLDEDPDGFDGTIPVPGEPK